MAKMAPIAGFALELFCTFQVRDTFKLLACNLHPIYQLQKIFSVPITAFPFRCCFLNANDCSCIHYRYQIHVNYHPCKILSTFLLLHCMNSNVSLKIVSRQPSNEPPGETSQLSQAMFLIFMALSF